MRQADKEILIVHPVIHSAFRDQTDRPMKIIFLQN
jgi:hypothetical protein